MKWFRWIFCGLVSLACAAMGQTTVNSLVVTNPSNYILQADAVDGDPATNRHLIVPQAEINFATAGHFRVVWDLLDPDANVVETDATLTGSIPAGVLVVTGNLAPHLAQPLQPHTYYRVRATVIKVADESVQATFTEPVGRYYIQLIGDQPSTTAHNALAIVTSVTVNREWLLETDPNSRTVPVTVGWELHRYDDWTGASVPQTVTLSIDPNLRRTGNNSEIASSYIPPAVTATIESYTLDGTTKVPAVVSGTTTLNIDPDEVMGLQAGYVRVKAAHIETPPLTVLSGGSMDSASVNFVHLGGVLKFGSIDSTFTHLAEGPQTYVNAPLDEFPTRIYRTLRPNQNSGTIAEAPEHTYSVGGSPLEVQINGSGVAIVTGGEAFLSTPNEEAKKGLKNGIKFVRGPLRLNANGARALSFTVSLPVGVGWAATRYGGVLESEIEFGEGELMPNLNPKDGTDIASTNTAPIFLCEETKPVYIEAAALTWNAASGEIRAGASTAAHSIRKPLLDFMASFSATYVSQSMVTKRSNDHLYNTVTAAANVSVKKGESGGGELTGTLAISPGSFTMHFPHDTTAAWAAVGGLIISGDVINTDFSVFTSAQPLEVKYNRHAEANKSCGTGTDVPSLAPTGGQYRFTSDGGLRATGAPTMPRLHWGYIAANESTVSNLDDHVQRVDTEFSTANFLMAGTFLRGDQNPSSKDNGAGVLLNSGFDAATGAIAERPTMESYKDGLGDYAGLNFRCNDAAYQARSTLQGSAFGPYTLTSRSKYYARRSGVTGIHEVVPGTFPQNAALAGYAFTFSDFGFSYLSNDIHYTRTVGSVDLPMPVDVEVQFERMVFDGLGMLTEFKVPSESRHLNFTGYNAPVKLLGARFVPTLPCDPSAGSTLVLGFKAHASQFNEEIEGELGVKPDGHFAHPSDPDSMVSPEVPTRITLKPVMTFRGRDQGDYTFVPSQGAYFNDDPEGAEGDGFWSLFGSIDVPFFEDLQVHIHARAMHPAAGTQLYVMGGWPVKGWKQGGEDPFTIPEFDPANDGWPQAVALPAYRKVDDNGNDNYLPRARQQWLGLIQFDYPAKWDGLKRQFIGRPMDPLDLKALTAEHELKYLDNNTAYISFGAKFNGMPEINLVNYVLDEVGEDLGVLQAITQAGQGVIFKTLRKGTNELADLLNDKVGMVEKAVDKVLEAPLHDYFEELRAIIEDGVWTEQDLHDLVDRFFNNANARIPEALQRLGDQYANAESFVREIDTRLANVERSIDALINTITIDPDTGELLATAQGGLLQLQNLGNNDLQRAGLQVLGAALAGVLEIAGNQVTADGRTVQQVIDDALASTEPAIKSVVKALEDLKGVIGDVRAQLQQGLELGGQIQDLFEDARAEVEWVAHVVGQYALEQVKTIALEDLESIDYYTVMMQTLLRNTIQDYFKYTVLIDMTRNTIRSYLNDYHFYLTQTIDWVFANVNYAVEQAVTDLLGPVDDAYDKLAGDIGEKLGKSKLKGYAKINEDSLEKLHMDGKFLLRPGADNELKISGWFEILRMDSDGPTGTGGTTSKTYEVVIGADDAPLDFISPDLRADMSVKFGFDTSVSAAPLALGGSFELTQGSINYETFTINDMGAMVMFSVTGDSNPALAENYFAAHVDLSMASSQLAGGVFFGRSATIDPIYMIDPLASLVIGEPPFTGAYVYGEATIPVVGTGTCMFNVSAKVGAGIFAFAEGPVGGRMTLGMFGQALCAVEVGGDVSLVGVKDGRSFRFAGQGHVYGKVGNCPVCLVFNKNIILLYQDKHWSVDF